MHAAGKGYPDLVRLRAGEPEGAPDAVVLPGSHEQLRAVLEVCASSAARGRAVRRGHERGGRRGAAAGEHGGVIALDMRRIARDRRARPRVADRSRVGAGMRAPALERRAGGARA